MIPIIFHEVILTFDMTDKYNQSTVSISHHTQLYIIRILSRIAVSLLFFENVSKELAAMRLQPLSERNFLLVTYN